MSGPESGNSVDCDGARMPMGPVIRDCQCYSSLVYNDYVVFDKNQVRMKYLAVLKFE